MYTDEYDAQIEISDGILCTTDIRCSDNYASDEAQSPRSGAAERRPPEHITYWNSWKQRLG